MNRLPCLTKREWDFFKQEEKDFFKKYNLQYKISLRRRIAMALCGIAAARTVGNYKGIKIINKPAAIKHYLKACIYHLDSTEHCYSLRKQLGLDQKTIKRMVLKKDEKFAKNGD